MFQHLKESSNRSQMKNIQFFNYIPVIVKDPFLSNIDVVKVIRKLQSLIPSTFVEGLDSIYIGDFNFLNERKLQAMYLDNVVYVSNIQKNEDSCATNILHELGHLVEDSYSNDIYGDGKLKKEFMVKRVWLYNFVKSHLNSDNMPLEQYKNVEYDVNFDKYLYDSLGYQLLVMNTASVFPSAYSITCLREYFGIGFEKFFGRNVNDREYLKSICPVLYEKIFNLQENYR
jgi:hypothetical protein